ncbi:hypothetical protein [Brumimicrobium mesophilum]|uniref:hypothetical protein n=1 Tax=Brumimicrobium mesophilum TaxID=392717 RepID=UPI000D141D0D|nr:hypothetical protein [Brumimicrobium mesophilum]
MIILSVPGTIRMVLIIIAIFVIIRFIGRIMATKKSVENEKRFNQNNDAFRKAKEKSESEKGKVHIVEGGYREAEDVDFEEIKDNEKKG